MVDYRGATVEDLQLSPALVLAVSTSIGTALQLAFERDFSILPLHSPSSRADLLGWLSIDELKPLAEQGKIDLDAPLSALMEGSVDDEAGGAAGRRPVKEFKKGRKYEVITPSTPLEELETFFARQKGPGGSGAFFALVTDAGRKFVLGVVTSEDLQKFTQRRFPSSPAPAQPNPTVVLPPSLARSAAGTATSLAV
ncbi:cystathionine beta-synthase [Rhodotorula toruloides]|uniref:Cystathionine beta-synthase n=1 Tax=Rhodotorula toruloides TaxID=5286 RepID=A0A511KK64_RHOTO|nr:cystathionine beta-synthase [Rhodotorula toruloides]